MTRETAQKTCEHDRPVGACGLCLAIDKPKCKHGRPVGACGLCEVEATPRCIHGKSGACAMCIEENA